MITDLDSIMNKLKGNLRNYKPIPFWSWNGDLKTDVLKSQIKWMKDNGLGGYFMHARNGLETEYLSDCWMQSVKECAEYGQSLDISSCLYDENGYPSGFAGGKLLEKEEYHDCYIIHTVGEFDENADINYLITENELIKTDIRTENGEYLNLYIKNSIGTADVLNEEVTDEFIKLTHEKYKEVFGNNFNQKISGIFTDEPQYYNGDTAYTRVLESYYYEKYGERLFDVLGLLFIKKKGWRRLRYRYWKCMQELILKNYAEKVYNWCEENGIKLTGHYVEETSLGYQLMFCGGVMPMYEYMHIPGIDWLGAGTDNELSPRQVTSVAAQLGKKQILTESFACCGWQIKPKNLKRIAEFQFVNGVNLLCHHLIPYSEYGIRKHDHPAHYSPINPWINYEFKSFNNYITRLGYLIAQSEEKVNVAVLHPLRSAYFDYDRNDCDEKERRFGLKKQDLQLKKDLRSISTKGINYHFIDETLFAKYGFINNKKIGCGKKEYDYLILPHIITMDSTTEKMLRQYVLNGGKVLILGDKPRFIEGDSFSYEYLSSNCSFEEIVKSQPVSILNYNTDLYMTYRTFEGKDFIFIQNASDSKSYEQVFKFDKKIKSFEKLNLETFETEIVPLSVFLEPEESALLFPTEKVVTGKQELKEITLEFNNVKADFNCNYLPLDKVSYSVNGLDYSEEFPCDGLVIKLGREKYKGEIYFKYQFKVNTLPNHIFLKSEQKNILFSEMNGIKIAFNEKYENGEKLYYADISKIVKQGINEYIVKMNWYQSKKVEYILEDNNIDGSLGNMLNYNSEIVPVYICGDFGVYSENFTEGENGYIYADNFYIGEKPCEITEPVYDGLPFFAGRLTLKQKINLDCRNVAIRVGGTQLLCYVKVNGKFAGKLMFNNSLDISEHAKTGENEIEVDLILSNRNLYGPFHFSGNSFFGVGPNCWDMRTDKWIGNKNSAYRENYELLRCFL